MANVQKKGVCETPLFRKWNVKKYTPGNLDAGQGHRMKVLDSSNFNALLLHFPPATRVRALRVPGIVLRTGETALTGRACSLLSGS